MIASHPGAVQSFLGIRCVALHQMRKKRYHVCLSARILQALYFMHRSSKCMRFLMTLFFSKLNILRKILIQIGKMSIPPLLHLPLWLVTATKVMMMVIHGYIIIVSKSYKKYVHDYHY